MSKEVVILLVSVVSAVALTVGLIFYWQHKHPCIRTEEQHGECGGGFTCSFWVPSSNGIDCFAWVYEPTYPCSWTECVERQN